MKPFSKLTTVRSRGALGLLRSSDSISKIHAPSGKTSRWPGPARKTAEKPKTPETLAEWVAVMLD